VIQTATLATPPCVDPTVPLAAERTVDWLFSAVMGLVEGLTEFLPISSTGHLIVTSRIFGRDDPAFEIAIQIGAISAILFLYRDRLWQAAVQVSGRRRDDRDDAQRGGVNLLWLIVAAALPPSILGLLFQADIEALLFNPTTVGVTLILGGVLLLLLERWERRRGFDEHTAPQIEDMTIQQALLIGLFQSLALVPGTSRSGATIVGAVLLGFRRSAAAEFSFLVGLPILYGASFVKLWDTPAVLEDPVLLVEFTIAAAMAFVSAALVVKPFVRFLQDHTFVPFAWYRIVVGVGLLTLVYVGYLERA
jgi:undecaprenyl-diphosphatase